MSKIKRNEIKNKPMKIPGVNLRSRAGMELVQVDKFTFSKNEYYMRR